MQAEAIEAVRLQPVRRDTLDLSALAWVQNELRRSLDAAHKALRRFVRESQTLSDSDVDVVDPSILRMARRQLHQGIGALELVGLPAAAQLLRASEAVVQRFAGRPGTLGLIRLMRHVIAHLAVTGGMAASDSLIQQMLGHGIAAKLSARLGEGLLNGLLTARLGLAAIDVTRPLPFAALPRPALSDLARDLMRRLGDNDAK